MFAISEKSATRSNLPIVGRGQYKRETIAEEMASGMIIEWPRRQGVLTVADKHYAVYSDASVSLINS
jgi:hypothetical protein